MSDKALPANGNAKRQLIIAGASVGIPVFIAFVSAIWWLSTLEGRVGSLEHDTASQRGEFSSRLDAVSHRENDLEGSGEKSSSEIIRLEESQKEIETQFCASDIVRNLMHANEMRNEAMLWQKTFGTTFPTDNSYYPQICNRATTADNGR